MASNMYSNIIKEVKHKINWVLKIKQDEGLIQALNIVKDGVLLKRKFFILTYELNSPLKKLLTNKDWEIIESDLEKLNDYRNENKCLPNEFYFDEIDGAKKFFMVVIRENEIKRPAAICWIYTNKQINRVISLKDEEVEMKHGITLDKFRNIGIFSTLVDYMMYSLKREGFRRVVNLIEVRNKPSIKIFTRYGFQNVAEKTFKKFMGFRVSTLYQTKK